jgi:hypothetical protein
MSFRIFINPRLSLLISAHFVDIKGKGSKPSCDVAPERTKAMLDIPEKDRSCKVLLTEGKLRPSSLWRWSAHNRSRRPYPSVKDFVSYVWIRRSFEILQYQMKFLSPVSDNERRFAVTSMSSARLNLPNDADALKKFRDEMARKRAAAARKSRADDMSKDALAPPEHIYTSSPEHSPAKKKQKRSSAVEKGKQVESSSRKPTPAPLVELPTESSGLSSFSAPTAFIKKSTDFILPADEKYLKTKRTEEVLDTTTLAVFQVSLYFCILIFLYFIVC